MHRLAVLGVATMLSACGRISFDAIGGGGDATDPDAVAAACTSWGPFGTPQLVTALSSAAIDWAPSVSADGLRMVFSSKRSGSQDLYVSARTSTANNWGTPALLQGFGTTSEQEDDPTLSGDGLEMLFGKNQMQRATRSATAVPFGTPTTIVPMGTFQLVQGAELSADGFRLYFSAGDPALSLYVMQRANRTDAFTTYDPVAINSTSDLGYPTLSADERELIVAQALTSQDDRDLFVTSRASTSATFSSPTPIAELASPDQDWDPELSLDGTTLWFASDRPPAQGVDIFVTTRPCLD